MLHASTRCRLAPAHPCMPGSLAQLHMLRVLHTIHAWPACGQQLPAYMQQLPKSQSSPACIDHAARRRADPLLVASLISSAAAALRRIHRYQPVHMS